jgi:hypothetical protein
MREYEDEIAAEDAHDAEVWRRIRLLRQHLLREIAADPARRVAWEVLVGPTDWQAIRNAKIGDPFPYCEDNMTRPSTILLFAAADGALLVDRFEWAGLTPIALRLSPSKPWRDPAALRRALALRQAQGEREITPAGVRAVFG